MGRSSCLACFNLCYKLVMPLELYIILHKKKQLSKTCAVDSIGVSIAPYRQHEDEVGKSIQPTSIFCSSILRYQISLILTNHHMLILFHSYRD